MDTTNTLKEQIISRIRKNRISTTEVADCLAKTGALPKVYSLNRRKFAVGEVKWIYAWNESNWELHEQVQDVDKDSILLFEAFSCGDRALFGELVSKYLLLYKEAQALVVQGTLRDAHNLIKEDWPIWLEGVTPIGCFNRKNEEPMNEDIIQMRRNTLDGSIAVCDDSGVVIIPKDKITEEFLEKLNWIEEQEDIWFDCIDRLKMSTYETVCLKNYEK